MRPCRFLATVVACALAPGLALADVDLGIPRHPHSRHVLESALQQAGDEATTLDVARAHPDEDLGLYALDVWWAQQGNADLASLMGIVADLPATRLAARVLDLWNEAQNIPRDRLETWATDRPAPLARTAHRILGERAVAEQDFTRAISHLLAAFNPRHDAHGLAAALQQCYGATGNPLLAAAARDLEAPHANVRAWARERIKSAPEAVLMAQDRFTDGMPEDALALASDVAEHPETTPAASLAWLRDLRTLTSLHPPINRDEEARHQRYIDAMMALVPMVRTDTAVGRYLIGDLAKASQREGRLQATRDCLAAVVGPTVELPEVEQALELADLWIEGWRNFPAARELFDACITHAGSREKLNALQYRAAYAAFMAEHYDAVFPYLDALADPAALLARDAAILQIATLARSGKNTEAMAVAEQSGNTEETRAWQVYLHLKAGHTELAKDAFEALTQEHGNTPEGRRMANILQPAVRRTTTATGETQPEQSTRPNILLISLDTVRPDFLSCYNPAASPTPNIDAIAARGIRYTNARSTSSWTKPAHASAFTGLNATAHGAMNHRDRIAPGCALLAEQFRDAGYTTLGVISAPPLNGVFGFARGFQAYDDYTYTLDREVDLFRRGLDGTVRIHSGFTGTLIIDRALELLRIHHVEGHPFFLFVNLFDAHHNYRPPWPQAGETADYWGKQYGMVDPWVNGARPFESFRPRVEPARLEALYAAEIAAVDKQVGGLIDHLKETSLLDNTLVILFGDHGDEFLEHGGLTHGRTLYGEVIRVPLIIAGPGVPEGQHEDTPVSLPDIFPSVLSLADIPLTSPAITGRTLPGLPAHVPPATDAHYATVDLPPYRFEAVVSGGYKAVRNLADGALELYDLSSDAAERFDQSNAAAAVATRMRALLDAERTRSSSQEAALQRAATLPEEPEDTVELERVIEQLRSLGYVHDN